MSGMTDTTKMTAEEFAKGLAALRWKQVEFADRTGVTKDTVNRWVHGRLAVPAWAANHLRLLLDAKQFCAAHVAPPPRWQPMSFDSPEYALRALRYLRQADQLRQNGADGADELERLARVNLEVLLKANSIDPDGAPV